MILNLIMVAYWQFDQILGQTFIKEFFFLMNFIKIGHKKYENDPLFYSLKKKIPEKYFQLLSRQRYYIFFNLGRILSEKNIHNSYSLTKYFLIFRINVFGLTMIINSNGSIVAFSRNDLLMNELLGLFRPSNIAIYCSVLSCVQQYIYILIEKKILFIWCC